MKKLNAMLFLLGCMQLGSTYSMSQPKDPSLEQWETLEVISLPDGKSIGKSETVDGSIAYYVYVKSSTDNTHQTAERNGELYIGYQQLAHGVILPPIDDQTKAKALFDDLEQRFNDAKAAGYKTVSLKE